MFDLYIEEIENFLVMARLRDWDIDVDAIENFLSYRFSYLGRDVYTLRVFDSGYSFFRSMPIPKVAIEGSYDVVLKKALKHI